MRAQGCKRGGAWHSHWPLKVTLSAGVHAAQAAKEKGGRKDVSAVALRMPYLRVVGLQEQAEGAHGTPDFTCGPSCVDWLLCVWITPH